MFKLGAIVALSSCDTSRRPPAPDAPAASVELCGHGHFSAGRFLRRLDRSAKLASLLAHHHEKALRGRWLALATPHRNDPDAHRRTHPDQRDAGERDSCDQRRHE
jgi:hypothetical protein